MSTFDLYFGDDLAGKLVIDDASRMTFKYNQAYVESEKPAISKSLPLSTRRYEDRVVFPFIENLLPEGEIRRLIAQHRKIADGDIRSLVRLLGGDVAGAISIQLEGHKPKNKHGAFEALSNEELSELLLNIQDRPFGITTGQNNAANRLSLAGAQNKLPVVCRSGEIGEAIHTPSTHIIKPARKDGRFSSIVYNEYICMKAAQHAGIDVANVELLDVFDHKGNETDALLIERYDRNVNTGARLHQEDLCQLSSIPSALKYEVNGGPGFARLFAKIRDLCDMPAKEDLEIFRRMMFNLVIGNYDAHGKNFSFLYEGVATRISPAYDLVCTAAYPELDQTFAMSIGGCTNIIDLKREHFEAMFNELGKNYKPLQKQLNKFANAALKALREQVNEFSEGAYYERDIRHVQVVLRIAERNLQAVLRALN